jgi:hypothetical protein
MKRRETPASPAETSTSRTEANGHDDDLAGDLLRGADEISRFLGWKLRVTRHALANGYLPARKAGLIYIASKQRLRRHFQAEAAPE